MTGPRLRRTQDALRYYAVISVTFTGLMGCRLSHWQKSSYNRNRSHSFAHSRSITSQRPILPSQAHVLAMGVVPVGGTIVRDFVIEVDDNYRDEELSFETSCQCVRVTRYRTIVFSENERRLVVTICADFADDPSYEGRLSVLVEARTRSGMSVASFRVQIDVVATEGDMATRSASSRL